MLGPSALYISQILAFIGFLEITSSVKSEISIFLICANILVNAKTMKHDNDNTVTASNVIVSKWMCVDVSNIAINIDI
jgi:hypothetical protein